MGRWQRGQDGEGRSPSSSGELGIETAERAVGGTYDGELAGRRGDPKAFLGQRHAVSARTSRSLGCGLKRRASQLRRHRRHAVPPGRPSSAAWLGLGSGLGLG